jgi:hypothetical protein
LVDVGRLLLILGISIALVGLILLLWPNLPLGRLPGDLRFRFGGGTVFVPIATSILLSLLLTLLLNLFLRRGPAAKGPPCRSLHQTGSRCRRTTPNHSSRRQPARPGPARDRAPFFIPNFSTLLRPLIE